MQNYRLWETSPAKRFTDAHLLGNGRLGASVMGDVPQEEIYINDDTLWSGSEGFYLNPQHYDRFREAQRLVLAGDVKAANNLINDEMEGRWFEAYMPLATLHITVGQKNNRRNMPLKRVLLTDEDPYEDYTRTLDLTRAVETIAYRRNGVDYRREVFVSKPHDAMILRLTAQGGPLHFAMGLSSQLHYVYDAQGNAAWLTGIAPDHAEPQYTQVTPRFLYKDPAESNALRFACRAQVIACDGTVAADGARVYVTDASYAIIALAAGTNYTGFRIPRDRDPEKILARLTQTLDALPRDYGVLEGTHVTDYQALYGRMDLDLGRSVTGHMPTSQRLSICTQGVDDPTLSALALQYARYLTIASSRPGTQAANLQGIWNDTPVPPWSSNYTNNINVQMNYWPCESLALSECHLPLMDLVRELAQAGEETARGYYHMHGWVAHHNADLWRATEPSCEEAAWSWWPFGGAWICQHIWKHYAYTQDKEFLRSMYPVLRGAAAFMLDFLVEDQDGSLVTAPSISPENKFITGGPETVTQLLAEIAQGSRCSPNDPHISAVTKGSTMDMSILRELFGNVIQAAEILGLEDDPLPRQAQEAMDRFPPYQVGRYGQLLEWAEDYEECCPGMGHISHMYPVYPGSIITETASPALMAAARRSLERRRLHGSGRGGWPAAWEIALFARFKMPLECGHILKSIGGRLGASLLEGSHRQIDVSFGWGAGVAEMLLQSHQGFIELIPAITVDMAEGSFTGMRARGGFVVSAAWKRGLPTTASIQSLEGMPCRVRAQGLLRVVAGGQTYPAQNGEAAFPTVPGETYTLEFA